jgi:uncharacterized protein YndB with AHSA1/START domain
MRLASYQVTIAAPVEVVWAHLTTAKGLVRRVVFTYGWEDGRLGVAPGSTTVEIDLVEGAGATTLRLVHHGLPPETVPDHQQGWSYFLGILRDTLSAG